MGGEEGLEEESFATGGVEGDQLRMGTGFWGEDSMVEGKVGLGERGRERSVGW